MVLELLVCASSGAAPIVHRTRRAVVTFASPGLTPAEMRSFTGLVDRGIRDVEVALGLPRRQRRPVRFLVSERVRISWSRGDEVFLPLARVRAKTAPYLHETAHVLVPCPDQSAWVSEGFASWVESYVSATRGGYDGHIFTRAGNASVDAEARAYLANREGRAVLPFVGSRASPRGMRWRRRSVAAPFYVLSQSFIKFLVGRLGVRRVVSLVEAPDVARALRAKTGRTVGAWKQEWLGDLASAGGP